MTAKRSAAVHALQRVLKEQGTDIHELAERVEGRQLSQAEMKRIYDAAYREGKNAAAAKTDFTNVEGPCFIRWPARSNTRGRDV